MSVTTTPTIETLSLVIISESSLDFGADSTYGKGKSSPPDAFKNPCCIRSLKTSHLIPFCLPPQIFADPTHMELSFAQRRSPLSVPRLPVSALCIFLYHTPRLEDLVIFDTIPVFDVMFTDAKAPLPHLRSFHWSDPEVKQVTRLMPLLYAPSLVKVDIWLDGPQQSVSSSDSAFSFHQSTGASRIVEYPRLKELNLQCMGASDSMKHVFSKFLFPALQKVEIANSAIESKSGTDEDPQLSPLPALTDIFRDPRLSRLTHLTLCAWNIPLNVGFIRAFLGCLPTLISFTLEKCRDVGTLLQCLQELVLVQFMLELAPQQRCDVKFCPRLEALTLWGCNDVEVACLLGLVVARNRNIEPMPCAVTSIHSKDRLNGALFTSTSGPGTRQRQGGDRAGLKG